MLLDLAQIEHETCEARATEEVFGAPRRRLLKRNVCCEVRAEWDFSAARLAASTCLQHSVALTLRSGLDHSLTPADQQACGGVYGLPY